MEKQSAIPIGVKVLAGLLFLFGLLAFFGSLFMWGEGFLLSFPPGVDYRYPITDILVNAPACFITASDSGRAGVTDISPPSSQPDFSCMLPLKFS